MMRQHDFDALYEQYSAVIDQMPETFTSHEFILRLAQQNQRLYIEALHSYRNSPREAPFMIVHGNLAKHLHKYPSLISYVDDVPSKDIFGQANGCARWRKI